ncbi:MAG: hypothetical protein V2A56_11960 [bacterium]
MNTYKRTWYRQRALALEVGIVLLALVQLGCRDTLNVARLQSPIQVDGDASDWDTYPRYFFEDAGVSIAFVNSDSVLFCLVQRRISTSRLMLPVTLWFEPKGGKASRFGVLLSSGPMGERGNRMDPMMDADEPEDPMEMPMDERGMDRDDRLEMTVRTGVQSKAMIRYGSDDLRTDIPADGSLGLMWATGIRKDVIVQEISILLGEWNGFDEFGQTSRFALDAMPGMKVKASLSFVQIPSRRMQKGPGGMMGGRPGGGKGGGGMGDGDMGNGGMSGPPPGGRGGGQLPQGGKRQLSESSETIKLRLAK